MAALAVDTSDTNRARQLVRVGKTTGCAMVKLGLELDYLNPEQQSKLTDGLVWLADKKITATTKTMPPAIRNYTELKHPPIGITVDANSGLEAFKLAQDIASAEGIMIFGVCVLSTRSDEEIQTVHGMSALELMMAQATTIVAGSGAEGIVTSAKELATIKVHKLTKHLFTMVVGSRSAGVKIEGDDQVRTDSIFKAVAAGADIVEIGREVSRYEDIHQMQEAMEIAQAEIAAGLAARRDMRSSRTRKS